MATVLPLFDLGRTPTTRDIAQLVKDGGVAALPDAKRRGDAATYQEVRCRSALNRCKGMPFMKWTLNPYRGCTHGCHYCFARRYQTQLELNAGDDFASVIFVKTNFVQVLRRELDKPSWAKENIGFGTATDPYQPIEGTYKISRGVLEALRDAATPVGIVTKGPMIVRDTDILQDLSKRTTCRVHISIPTVDEDAWEKLEPGVAHPMQRLRAVRALVDAGIDCGVLMAPIVPGFSTQPAKMERTIKAIARIRRAFGRRDGDAPRRRHARSLHGDAQSRVSGDGREIRKALREQVRLEGLRQARAGSRVVDARAIRNQRTPTGQQANRLAG